MITLGYFIGSSLISPVDLLLPSHKSYRFSSFLILVLSSTLPVTFMWFSILLIFLSSWFFVFFLLLISLFFLLFLNNLISGFGSKLIYIKPVLRVNISLSSKVSTGLFLGIIFSLDCWEFFCFTIKK